LYLRPHRVVTTPLYENGHATDDATANQAKAAKQEEMLAEMNAIEKTTKQMQKPTEDKCWLK
jgi:hypothetical protein